VSDSQFVAYGGPWGLHDGQIQEVRQDEDSVIVHVSGNTGSAIRLKFQGVSAVKAIKPVGMVLYALCEMSAPTPYRRFMFANWSEDNPSMLEVLAKGFRTEY
jgi:hypothetical protein